jgi:hypothetical protein|tara:strand:- start:1865 stop:2215 length:351 start_codon:yes stop_codon:yes gene_type:complete
MDLKKMHPMARKLGVHADAFSKALETGDAMAAQDHLNEIKKFAGYLSEDIHMEITKAERSEDTQISTPIMKMNTTGEKFDSSQRDAVLPGMILAARTGGPMRVHRGTFGHFTPGGE